MRIRIPYDLQSNQYHLQYRPKFWPIWHTVKTRVVNENGQRKLSLIKRAKKFDSAKDAMDFANEHHILSLHFFFNFSEVTSAEQSPETANGRDKIPSPESKKELKTEARKAAGSTEKRSLQNPN